MTTFGKRREFQKAYNDFYPLIFNRLYAKLGKREDAEDICQEVFLKFLNSIGDINKEKMFAWLLTATRYETYSYYRKKGITKSNVDIQDVENDPVLSFENGARDIRIIINEAINNEENFRNDQERIIFNLIAIYRYTFNEVSAEIGLTARQVRYKYGLILNKILDFLKKKGISNIEDLI